MLSCTKCRQSCTLGEGEVTGEHLDKEGRRVVLRRVRDCIQFPEGVKGFHFCCVPFCCLCCFFLVPFLVLSFAFSFPSPFLVHQFLSHSLVFFLYIRSSVLLFVLLPLLLLHFLSFLLLLALFLLLPLLLTQVLPPPLLSSLFSLSPSHFPEFVFSSERQLTHSLRYSVGVRCHEQLCIGGNFTLLFLQRKARVFLQRWM